MFLADQFGFKHHQMVHLLTSTASTFSQVHLYSTVIQDILRHSVHLLKNFMPIILPLSMKSFAPHKPALHNFSLSTLTVNFQCFYRHHIVIISLLMIFWNAIKDIWTHRAIAALESFWLVLSITGSVCWVAFCFVLLNTKHICVIVFIYVTEQWNELKGFFFWKR